MHCIINRSSITWLLFCLLYLIPVKAQDRPASKLDEHLTSHVQLLNELSERRRVNTFFNNEQSIFHGLQKGFVNVGQGNLSLTQRDLVTVGRMPISIARVYDSNLLDIPYQSDFSGGWQLSLAETIKVKDDNTLLYRDGSAVLNKLIPSTVGYQIYPTQNSDIKSVVFNSQGRIQIDYLTGWTKQFDKMGHLYRLVKITDNNGKQLNLDYINNKLTLITTANSRSITIDRDDSGRIISVTDNNNRVVRYGYNQAGRLESITDLGGNLWRYQYHDNGLLYKVVDPLNQQAAKFIFNKNKQISHLEIRAQKYHYRYKGNKTTVKDHKGNTSIFSQNLVGITTSVTNAEGFTSSIVLNKHNQISELWHNGQQQARIVYDDNGRPSRYDINGKPTQMETLQQNQHQQYSYQYDKSGRITNLATNDGEKIEYTYNESGNLTQRTRKGHRQSYLYNANGDIVSETVTRGELAPITITFGYNADGQLSTQTQYHLKTYFGYNATGKLSKITFPNGKSHQYRYDKLGFRTHTKRSDNSSISYLYDSLGNLRISTKTNASQQSRTAEIQTLNEDNQLIELAQTGKAPLKVTYSRSGNPVSIIRGNKTTEYQYDQLGRLISINDNEDGQSSYQYKQGEVDIRLQLDDRSRTASSSQSKITSHNQNQAQLHYARMAGTPWQAVSWNESLSKLLVPSPEALNAPDAGYQSSKQRRRLYNAIATAALAQYQFDKPSNAFFIPPEYQAINCVIGEGDDCNGKLTSLVISVQSGGTVGQTIPFRARAAIGGYCEAEYTLGFQGFVATNNTGYFQVPLTQAGTHNAVATVECCGRIKWYILSYTVAETCPPLVNGVANASGCLPIPVDFRQTASGKLSDGTLTFTYEWDSSNGNISELDQCDVSEEVTYPGSNDPYTFPLPWDHQVPNPTGRPLSADGYIIDNNKPPFITKPYQQAEVTAIQRFKWRCPYHNDGKWQDFILPFPEPIGFFITRKVIKNPDGTYRYEITKSGEKAAINPLP